MSTSAYASLNRISDTVKPRFLFPNGITDLTVDLPGQSAAPPTLQARRPSAQREAGTTETIYNPSRWKTKEFYLYYVVFILVVPNMVTAVVKLSRGRSQLGPTVAPPPGNRADPTAARPQNRTQTITPLHTGSGLAGSLAGK